MVRAHMVALAFAAAFTTVSTSYASSDEDDDFPPGISPLQAEPGDWAADFNQALIDCFNGSMATCDGIWLSKRILMDTYLYQYARTCGGRVSLEALREAGAFRLQGPSMHCIEIFPGHE